jgi:predicted DNA-binding protein with PD1-like motif
MRDARLGDSYLVRLDAGEEIVAAVAAFAADRRLDAASVAGTGAAHHVVLGCYDPAARGYVRRAIDGSLEIASLAGIIAVTEGRACPHLHAVLGGRDLAAMAGRFFEGRVVGTCELVIRPMRGYAQRVENVELGLFLLDL